MLETTEQPRQKKHERKKAYGKRLHTGVKGHNALGRGTSA
jgi:hypothetical protein